MENETGNKSFKRRIVAGAVYLANKSKKLLGMSSGDKNQDKEDQSASYRLADPVIQTYIYGRTSKDTELL